MSRCIWGWVIWLNFVGGLALGADAWPLEAVRLKSGATLTGLVGEENNGQYSLKQVLRAPGLPPYVVEGVLDAAEVEQIERLPAAERTKLVAHLAAAERDKEAEIKRRGTVVFKEIRTASGTVRARQYDSKYLIVESDLPEATLREVVVRLEDVFELLTHKLRPKSPVEKPLRIVVFNGLAEFQSWQKKSGQALHGLACYDAKFDGVAAGTEIGRLAGELEKVKLDHQDKSRRLDEFLVRLKAHFGGKPPLGGLQQVRSIRQQMVDFDFENQVSFNEMRTRFLAALADAVLQGYLDRFICPGWAGGGPRWLGAGLGQMVEAAVEEPGPLQLEAISKSRLTLAQAALRKGELTPIERLISAQDSALNPNHVPEPATQDRDFLTAWALAQFVLGERRLLGAPAVEEYLTRTNKTTDARAGFEKLVGQPLPEFEKQFHVWLQNVAPPR